MAAPHIAENESVLVLTFATDETAYFPALRESAKKQGFAFEALGLGQKWQGFMWANELLMDRMRKCDPEQLVLLVDGYDTLVTMPCAEMVERYSKVCAEASTKAGTLPSRWLIFGIEHPREACSVPYWNVVVKSARKYHLAPPDTEVYVNTGAALGPARHMLTYLDETVRHARATKNKDDQNAANALYWGWWVHPEIDWLTRAESPLPIALDRRCELFYCFCERRIAFLLFQMAASPNNQSTPAERELLLQGGGVYRKHTGVNVGVVHGIWNTNMNAICEHLGYTPVARYHKEVSQPDIRIVQKVLGFVLIWPGGPVWLLLAFAYAMGYLS